MAESFRTVSNSLEIMRRALGRKNANDPDSDDEMLLSYFNDAISISMTDDVRVIEQYGTLSFEIVEGVGTYEFNDVGADTDFNTISLECFISLLEPEGSSVSWNRMQIFQDPGEFYSIWGINNEDILIQGYPTNLLFYGNELVFRTIPNDTYLVKIYGYKKNPDNFTSETNLPFDYWVRYLAYLAALNYAQDFRYDDAAYQGIKRGYMRERKLMLTRTHNQIKNSRALPRF